MTRTPSSPISGAPRKRLRLAGIALLLVGLPVLAGCEAGMDAPTVDFHPIGAGAYATADGTTINNAFILGPPVGQVLQAGSQAGLFLSIYSASGDRLESATAAGVASSVHILPGSVSVPFQGTTNLNGPSPELVLTGLTAPLTGGQTVTVALTFARAGTVTVSVPVQAQAYDYATFQQPAALPASPTATSTTAATATSSASTTAKHATKHHAPASATSTASPSPTP